MTSNQEKRLRTLAQSPIVGGDIKAAMEEIDRLRQSTLTGKASSQGVETARGNDRERLPQCPVLLSPNGDSEEKL